MASGIISVPNTAAHLQTSMNLQEFLEAIAFPVGAKGRPDKVMALRAFHMALDWIVNSSEWNYYHVTDASGTTVAGTSTYTVPTRIRSVDTIRVPSGNPRRIRPINKAKYNAMVWDQSSNSTFMWYQVQNMAQDSVITLLPTPDAAESFTVDYYRDPSKITDEASKPDIAQWMEAAVILRAQYFVTLWAGRPDKYEFRNEAEKALQLAIERDHNGQDEGGTFEPDPTYYNQSPWPWNHPNRDYDY